MRTRWKIASGPIVAVAIAVAVLVWGVAIEPRFLSATNVTEAPIPNLPRGWDGKSVALVADFQIGMWWDNDRMVSGLIDQIIEARPALVLIAGDFVYEPDSTTVRRATELVRPLVDAGVRTIAVLGNHDYALGSPEGDPNTRIAAYLEALLEAAGVTVLENEAVAVELDGDSLYVAGIGSAWADRARPMEALADVPERAPRLVFMHNPVVFRDLPAYSAPLAMAGHTHGGQIRIPFTPSESWLDVARPREVIADGWALKEIGRPGNRLYVNRGIGFSVVPIRINCRPELTYFTLRPAEAQHRPPDSTG